MAAYSRHIGVPLYDINVVWSSGSKNCLRPLTNEQVWYLLSQQTIELHFNCIILKQIYNYP